MIPSSPISVSNKCLIYGSLGQASSIALEFYRFFDIQVIGFIDDYVENSIHKHMGLPIRPYTAWRNDHLPILLAMGSPATKRQLVERLEAMEPISWACCIPNHLNMAGACLKVEAGTYISHSASVNFNVHFGRHVGCMPQVTIGHDVTVGDFTTICPGAKIAGNVSIEEGCFIGTNAVITNGRNDHPLVIGKNSIISAGAVVFESTRPGSKMIGNPAVTMRDFIRQQQALRKLYAL